MSSALKSNWFKISGVVYLLLLCYLLFLAPFRQGLEGSVNLVPFKSIIQFCRNFDWSLLWYWVINVPANVVAFIPIPIIIYSFTGKALSALTKLAMAVLIPSVIEGTQFLFNVGASNIDDVILNCSGFYIGFLLLRRWY